MRLITRSTSYRRQRVTATTVAAGTPERDDDGDPDEALENGAETLREQHDHHNLACQRLCGRTLGNRWSSAITPANCATAAAALAASAYLDSPASG